MKNILSQFIPIILLYLLLSFSKEFALFSHTVLGKLLAVIIIVYYTVIDKTIGLLVCSLTILYYQSEFIENMLNMDSIMGNLFKTTENMESMGKTENLKTINTEKMGKKKELNVEGMATINDVYNSENRVEKSFEEMQNQTGFRQEFRQQYCNGSTLKYKEMNVKADMIEHVFPEVEYKDEKCNPCSDKCDFSVIENRLQADHELKPKISKDEL
jgi:ABC-type multidrug transport system fused ATPase/permease subunit